MVPLLVLFSILALIWSCVKHRKHFRNNRIEKYINLYFPHKDHPLLDWAAWWEPLLLTRVFLREWLEEHWYVIDNILFDSIFLYLKTFLRFITFFLVTIVASIVFFEYYYF